MWWKERIGTVLLGNITKALLIQIRDELSNSPNTKGKVRAPATVVKYMVTIIHVFSVCEEEWGWINHNPAKKVQKPSLPRGRTRFLDDEEREKLLVTCQESSNKYLYTITVLALSTGMRRSEILTLRWRDINLERTEITLNHTKNNDIRIIPLAGHALEVVQELESTRRIDTDLLFPSPNGKQPIDFRSAWRSAVKKAGIEDFKFHDCRHSCASYLMMDGASLGEVAEILGHRNIQMSKRYSHLSNAHKLKVLTSMNSKIFG